MAKTVVKQKHAKGWSGVFPVSFAQGTALLAAELLSAKLTATYYGNSLYVWATAIGLTLGGLVAGYLLGSYFAGKQNKFRILLIVLAAAGILTALMPFTAVMSMELFINGSFEAGIVLSALLYFFPVIALLGMVSPLLVAIVDVDPESSGKLAGSIFAVSTVGGVMATFIYAFYFIPNNGITTSCLITAILLLLSMAIFYSRNKNR